MYVGIVMAVLMPRYDSLNVDVMFSFFLHHIFEGREECRYQMESFRTSDSYSAAAFYLHVLLFHSKMSVIKVK